MTDVRSVWPLYVAAFLATFQLSLANISIPDLRHDLGATPAQLSLVVGAFTAAFAAGLVTAGHLGDRHGRRRLFLAGLTALLLATLLAAAAPSIGFLLAVRVVQGLASAVMMPQILATIQAVLEGHRRTVAVAIFSGTSGVGTVAGQVIGGAVITASPAGFGWRGAQLTGAVVTAAALIGARHLPDTRSADPDRIDLVGSLLLGTGLLGLVCALSLGPSSGWAAWDLALIAAAALVLVALVLHQRRAGRTGRPAVLPVAVVGLPAVRTGSVMALLFFAGFGAFMFDFSVLTQQTEGLSAMASGLSIGLFAIAFVVTAVVSPGLVRRLGARLMVAGAVLQVASLIAVAALSYALVDHWVWWFQPVGIVMGVGQAWMYAPMVGVVMQAVPDHAAGLTGGLVATAQQAALGLGVAVLGGLFGQLSASVDPVQAFGTVAVVQIGLSALFGVLAWRLDRRTRRGCPSDRRRVRTDVADNRAGNPVAGV